jgi:hypothetical protein
MNSSIFHPAFFGYENLPDSIELDNHKLIPIKALRLKYQGKSQSKGAFCAENIRSLCNILSIELHRPVRGLYCIEEHYSKFFDYLYQFYSQHAGSFLHHNSYYYASNGDLIWYIHNWKTGAIREVKKCDGKLIKTLFRNFT